jgi:hypothetical protein
MKTNYLLTIVILMSLLMLNCKSRKQTADKEKNKSNQAVSAITVHESYSYPKDAAPFEITKASIKGDILTLDVSYSGGCKDHSFSLHGTKMYMKSMPPKLGIFLEHEANGDSCRELKTEQLNFNISEIKYPGTEKDYTIIISINNYEGEIEYKY